MKKLRIGVKGHTVNGSYIIDGRFLEVTSDFGTARVVLGLSNADSLARALVKSMVERSSGVIHPTLDTDGDQPPNRSRNGALQDPH